MVYLISFRLFLFFKTYWGRWRHFQPIRDRLSRNLLSRNTPPPLYFNALKIIQIIKKFQTLNLTDWTVVPCQTTETFPEVVQGIHWRFASIFGRWRADLGNLFGDAFWTIRASTYLWCRLTRSPHENTSEWLARSCLLRTRKFLRYVNGTILTSQTFKWYIFLFIRYLRSKLKLINAPI